MNIQTASKQATGIVCTQKIDLESLVVKTLPPSPSSIMRISRLLNDDNASMRRIIEAIGFQPMLVTRILRFANSTIYALDREVTSIQSAIAVIGNTALQEIIMMEIAAAFFAKHIRSSFTARKIWEHSLATAIIARELAEMMRIQGMDEAFTCGLLHDIVKMILLSYDFEGYPLLQGENDEARMLDCERRHYGYDHSEIGAFVTRRWNLSQEICDCIEYHHCPAMAKHASLVTYIVEVADNIANIRAYGLRVEEKSRLLESESVKRLNLTSEALESVWTHTDLKIKEAIVCYA